MQESLRAAGFRGHGLGQLVQEARREGVLTGEALRAARRVQRRGNRARHPSEQEESEDAPSLVGLDVVWWTDDKEANM